MSQHRPSEVSLAITLVLALLVVHVVSTFAGDAQPFSTQLEPVFKFLGDGAWLAFIERATMRAFDLYEKYLDTRTHRQ
ncbi:hypothetical protein ACTQ9L_16280 [Deinococcus wulumuqiensis]